MNPRQATHGHSPAGRGRGVTPRLLAAVGACGLALALLSSGAGSWARWADEAATTMPPLSSGGVDLAQSGDPVLQLWSHQPAGSRTYVSSTTCPISGDILECRDVSSTFSNERLVPGDTVRIIQSVTLAAQGKNLRGDLSVDASQVVNSSASPLSGIVEVSVLIQDPAGTRTSLPGNQGELPVSVADGTAVGTWVVEIDVVIPAADVDSGWGTDLRAEVLDLESASFAFTQTTLT